MHPRIPMPPDRYGDGSSVATIAPDRCPHGHRADDPHVQMAAPDQPGRPAHLPLLRLRPPPRDRVPRRARAV